jgi:hypothetical protein
MPDTTRGYTYPASTDHTRIWEHLQTLATDIDTDVGGFAIASQAAVDATSRQTTSASFTHVLSPANTLGVAFTAPPSGKVMIHIVCDLDCSGGVGSFAEAAPHTRTGAVLASGSDVEVASHGIALLAYDGNQMRMGCAHRLTGLTPGSSYNTVMAHATSTGTGTFRFREITVVPLAA